MVLNLLLNIVFNRGFANAYLHVSVDLFREVLLEASPASRQGEELQGPAFGTSDRAS